MIANRDGDRLLGLRKAKREADRAYSQKGYIPYKILREKNVYSADSRKPK